MLNFMLYASPHFLSANLTLLTTAGKEKIAWKKNALCLYFYFEKACSTKGECLIIVYNRVNCSIFEIVCIPDRGVRVFKVFEVLIRSQDQ